MLFMKGAFRLLRRLHAALKPVPAVGPLLLGAERGAVRLLEGCRRLRTHAGDPLSFRLRLLLGTYEPMTVRYLRSRLRPGMVAVDVGANVGYFARLMAEAVGREGVVVALEPNPATFVLLRENTAHLPQVLAFPLAAAEAEGVYGLEVPRYSSGVAHLREASGGLPVYGVPLGKLLQGLGLERVDLLKLDVEGAEPLVLRSLGPFAERVAEVLTELEPRNLARFGFAPQGLLAVLQEMGFRRFRVMEALTPEGRGSPLAGDGLDSQEGWHSPEEVLAFLREIAEGRWRLDPDHFEIVNLLARR